jgi:hypothetical protein
MNLLKIHFLLWLVHPIFRCYGIDTNGTLHMKKMLMLIKIFFTVENDFGFGNFT